jgi:membrane protein YdbS with pleckstrin-like domain
MELDDLKKQWAKPDWNHAQAGHEHEADAIQAILSKSKRGIRRIFSIEMGVGLFMYVLFGVLAFWVKDSIALFLYKLVAVITVFAIPIYYRIYRSIRLLETADYGKDMKTHLSAFLTHYKITMAIYQWGSYVMIIGAMIVFYTDESFMRLSLSAKVWITVYMIVCMIITKPMVKRFYGRKVKSMEAFVNES